MERQHYHYILKNKCSLFPYSLLPAGFEYPLKKTFVKVVPLWTLKVSRTGSPKAALRRGGRGSGAVEMDPLKYPSDTPPKLAHSQEKHSHQRRGSRISPITRTSHLNFYKNSSRKLHESFYMSGNDCHIEGHFKITVILVSIT